MGELGSTQVSFQLQVGMMKDKVTVDLANLTLKSIKENSLITYKYKRFTDNIDIRIIYCIFFPQREFIIFILNTSKRK